MKIKAVLPGFVAKKLKQDISAELAVPERTTVGELGELLGLPAGIPFEIMIGGEAVSGDRLLRDGEEVTFLTPISGG